MDNQTQYQVLSYLLALEEAITYSGIPLEVTTERPKCLWNINADTFQKKVDLVNMILPD